MFGVGRLNTRRDEDLVVGEPPVCWTEGRTHVVTSVWWRLSHRMLYTRRDECLVVGEAPCTGRKAEHTSWRVFGDG